MTDTLTLSGWTQPEDAVAKQLPDGAAVFDYSDYASPEKSFEGLRRFKDVPNVVAWSMGGQLALRAIAAGVLKPKHLTLIAAPYQFVSPFGMDAFTFTQFRENYATNATRAKERFHGLIAKGDAEPRRIIEMLGHHHAVENTARWLPWLDDLGNHSMDLIEIPHVVPTLIVQGRNDVIVPLGQSQAMAAKLPHAQLNAWQNVGHAPHVHDANRLWREIQEHRKLSGL